MTVSCPSLACGPTACAIKIGSFSNYRVHNFVTDERTDKQTRRQHNVSTDRGITIRIIRNSRILTLCDRGCRIQSEDTEIQRYSTHTDRHLDILTHTQIQTARHINTQTLYMLMVCSTKVLCPQNLFSTKSQRYKGRTSRYVDIRPLWF